VAEETFLNPTVRHGSPAARALVLRDPSWAWDRSHQGGRRLAQTSSNQLKLTRNEGLIGRANKAKPTQPNRPATRGLRSISEVRNVPANFQTSRFLEDIAKVTAAQRATTAIFPHWGAVFKAVRSSGYSCCSIHTSSGTRTQPRHTVQPL